jgi:hypothetical protein
MSGSAGQQTRFDPFTFIPLFPGRLRRMHTGWIVLAGLGVFLLVVLATFAEDTLGGPSDLRHYPKDVQYAFSDSVPRTEPSFPLARDVTSCMCLALIVAGFALLHRHWYFISIGLTELRESDTIVPRRRPKSNAVSRLLGVDRLLRDREEHTALDHLNARFGDVSPRTKALLSGSVLLASLTFAVLLADNLSQNIFRVLAPTDATPAERNAWVALAKQNWWAGPDHPIGLALYTALAFVAIVLIFTFNVVGVITVYFTVALYFAAEPGADWYNRDGRYGWTPVARVYRTVYWALVLLGTGIATLIAVLGSKVPVSVFALILLYAILAPVYTLVPWFVFRNVEQTAKARRRAELSLMADDVDNADLDRVQLLAAEFARCNEARIRPMRLRKASFGAYATVVLLPIILTFLQIFAPFGAHGR